jgi:predicted ATPase
MLAEALEAVRNTGEYWCEAELYRLRGELVEQQGTGQKWVEVETCFQQALDVSRRQEAKALELRATMSLSRLWQRQGKHAEARELLAPVYGWFTEGVDHGRPAGGQGAAGGIGITRRQRTRPRFTEIQHRKASLVPHHSKWGVAALEYRHS